MTSPHSRRDARDTSPPRFSTPSFRGRQPRRLRSYTLMSFRLYRKGLTCGRTRTSRHHPGQVFRHDARVPDLFRKTKSREVLRGHPVSSVRESDKYASLPAIGSPWPCDRHRRASGVETMKPLLRDVRSRMISTVPFPTVL
jgi:hypothetical protein